MYKNIAILIFVLLFIISNMYSQEYFIFMNEDNIYYNATIKEEKDSWNTYWYLSDEAVNILGLNKENDNKYKIKIKGEYRKGNLYLGKNEFNLHYYQKSDLFNVFKDNKRLFSDIEINEGDTSKYFDRPIELIDNNNNKSFVLINIIYKDLVIESEKKYKKILFDYDENKRKNDILIKKIEGLTTKEINLGNIKFQNYSVSINYSIYKSWAFDDVIIELKLIISDSYKTKITIIDVDSFINFLLKYKEWYQIAKENNVKLDKEIGKLNFYISWFYNSKDYKSLYNNYKDLLISFITTNNDYFISLKIPEIQSSDNQFIKYPEKYLYISYEDIILLLNLLKQDNIDSLINKQKEIDKSNHDLFK